MLSDISLLLFFLSLLFLVYLFYFNNSKKINISIAIIYIIVLANGIIVSNYIIPLAEGLKEYKIVDKPDGSRTWEFVNVKKDKN